MTPPPEYRGLTWDHPRGRDALAAAAARANAGRDRPLILWEAQPLEGFESAPIADLAARYDVLVIDHPHLGEAAAEDCLTPIEEVFGPEAAARWAAAAVGPAMASYRWGGRHYALPLDVACQVVARRPDRIAAPPQDWEEMAEIARGGGVALSLAGPHAVLTLMSLAGSRGAVPQGEAFLPDDAALPALDWMRRLHALRPPGSEAMNPIALLEAMARGEAIALVPLVFGYAPYARAAAGRRALAFSDTPRAGAGFGGVLGGTGIALSRRARVSADLRAHLAWLLSDGAQRGFIPRHNGQPGLRAAWTDASVNADWAGFYQGTLATAGHALLRPRFDGYIAFQTAASAALRAGLAAGEPPERMLAGLRSLWRTARDRARGGADDDRFLPPLTNTRDTA